jgi:hypothetical protein
MAIDSEKSAGFIENCANLKGYIVNAPRRDRHYAIMEVEETSSGSFSSKAPGQSMATSTGLQLKICQQGTGYYGNFQVI